MEKKSALIDNQETMEKETEETHLAQTILFLGQELEALAKETLAQREELVEARRDMIENTSQSSRDFERLTEMVQSLLEVTSQAASYTNKANFVKRYQKLLGSPYFGRFDFIEDGYGYREQFYIGLGNVMDRETRDVYVYDWRAPISSIYYRFERGRASYETPQGISNGEVLLKRQYKIRNGQLQYYFDADIRITDEVLHEILGHNASPQMKAIVETIQKEQDLIIRDTESQLLIVQGSAGSGKTSIALHRIAFLLYENMRQIRSQQMIILSPNDVFSQYISSVLPELGEENVQQATFDDLLAQAFQNRFPLDLRIDFLEELIQNDRLINEPVLTEKVPLSMGFKGSLVFLTLLDRWLLYYARRLHPFEDVSFHGVMLATRQQLRNRFLHNEIDIPMAKQLQRLEAMLLAKLKPYKKERLVKVQRVVDHYEGRELEVRPFSRLLAIKDAQAFRRRLARFTKVDPLLLYRQFFADPDVLIRLAKGLLLPTDFREIITSTQEILQRSFAYEDYAPLLYLKLKIEGGAASSDIKHVVIDEAQDYSPVQYRIFQLLFPQANFTVLGDMAQTIDTESNLARYEELHHLFAPRKTTQLSLSKSYRSTVEIHEFTQRLMAQPPAVLPFERHGNPPRFRVAPDQTGLVDVIGGEIQRFLKEGYGTVAVICKTQQEAEAVHTSLKALVPIHLIRPHDKAFQKGPLMVSSYMAKGLEFDVVILYNVSSQAYATPLDKQLLYIACTRAMHELVLTYTGKISPFLSETI